MKPFCLRREKPLYLIRNSKMMRCEWNIIVVNLTIVNTHHANCIQQTVSAVITHAVLCCGRSYFFLSFTCFFHFTNFFFAKNYSFVRKWIEMHNFFSFFFGKIFMFHPIVLNSNRIGSDRRKESSFSIPTEFMRI